jgi:hypothetical protein
MPFGIIYNHAGHIFGQTPLPVWTQQSCRDFTTASSQHIRGYRPTPVVTGPAPGSMESPYIYRIRKPQYGRAQHRHKRLVKMNDIEFFPFQNFLYLRGRCNDIAIRIVVPRTGWGCFPYIQIFIFFIIDYSRCRAMILTSCPILVSCFSRPIFDCHPPGISKIIR